MLVLSRKYDQDVVLELSHEAIAALIKELRETGESPKITVKVINIAAHHVRLGFTAHPEINIYRKELGNRPTPATPATPTTE